MVGGAAFAPLWVCAAVLARLAGRLLRDRGAQVPVAVAGRRAASAYQRSSRTISSSGAPAAGRRRPGEVGRVGRVAEREQVLAVLVGRVAEQARGRGRARRRSPGRCRCRAPRPPASCSGPPGRGRTGSTAGRPVDAGSGVTRAIADGRARRGGRPTARPSSSSSRCSRSRQTMNVQRCRFLLLPARRPASRIRSRWRPRAGGRRTRGRRACVAIAAQTGSRLALVTVVTARSRSPAGSRLAGVGTRRSRRARAARPGRASASRPAVARWRSNAALAVGDPLGRRRRPRPRRRPSGSSGPPRAARQERRDRAAGSRGPRTATNAGRPATTRVSTGAGVRVAGRVAGPGGGASRSRWPTGTTVSSSPWASRTGPS